MGILIALTQSALDYCVSNESRNAKRCHFLMVDNISNLVVVVLLGVVPGIALRRMGRLFYVGCVFRCC